MDLLYRLSHLELKFDLASYHRDLVFLSIHDSWEGAEQPKSSMASTISCRFFPSSPLNECKAIINRVPSTWR